MSQADDSGQFGSLSSAGITVTYAVVGATWILFSDQLLAIMISSPDLYTTLQTGKGWLFVAASSGLIYLLISRREAELADRNERLERALQQLSILHRVLRHNLRNSCNVVKGYVELLAEDAENAEEIAIIESNLDDMIKLSEKSHLLRDIVLDGPDAVHSVDLPTLLREQIVAFQADHPDVDVDVDLPDRLPVHGHSRLGDGIGELIENAAVHNDAATPHVWVSIHSNDEETVAFDIADNGPGVPDIEREVAGSREEQPLFHSQGIGIWVARAAVDQSDGRIRFVDNEPRGAIARITLRKATNPDAAPGT